MVNYVMNFAPIGVLEQLRVFAVRDFQELAITYFKFFGSFNRNFTLGYIDPCRLYFLKSRMTVLLKRIVSPLIIALGQRAVKPFFQN
jgi:hypothetical protein